MRNLICEYGSEFDLDSNRDYIKSDINQSLFMGAELFRSGRDTLKAIAKRYKSICKRILLPALCCESMVTPFQTNGYEVSYYKLNPNLTANIEDIILKLQPNDVFLYMNYFGFQSLSDEELQFIRDQFPNLSIIEDRTHDIFSLKSNQFEPDFTVCSIRKWLSIPDGGILYAKGNQGNFFKNDDTLFGDTRIKAFKNKSEYLINGDSQLKELFRSQFAEADEYLENDNEVVGMSSVSIALLKNIDYMKIADVRRKNVNYLISNLNKTKSINQIHSEYTDKVFLYYPILVENRDRLQHLLAQSGVYCPVIWPLPKQAENVCEVSDKISMNMLAIPCDQRYGAADMERISSTLIRILGE